VVGDYLTHGPSNVTCMQIVRSNITRRSRTSITRQCNLLLYNKGLSTLKSILTHCLKNWIQKDQDKWPPNHLLWKRWARSLMKRSISHPSALCTSMAIRIKWCPSWSLLYLRILAMALSFTIAPISQLMTFETTISCIGSVTTTSATKT
jgi:hypothetical protein